MSSCRPLLLAALAAFVGLPHSRAPRASVQAGTALRLELESAVERADVIVEGRVSASIAVLAAPSAPTTSAQHGRIESHCTLALSRTFLGPGAATLELRLPGGVLPDGRGLALPGLPRLAVGDEVVLLLSKPSRAGLRLPIGLSQGVLRVVRAADGTRRLAQDLEANTLVDASGRPVAGAGSSALLDYDATIARIEGAVAARRAREAQPGGGRR